MILRQKRRIFSDAFKIETVKRILDKKLSPLKVVDETGKLVHYPSIRNWITQHQAGLLGKQKTSLAERITELEKIVLKR